jgi:hypothetical protein
MRRAHALWRIVTRSHPKHSVQPVACNVQLQHTRTRGAPRCHATPPSAAVPLQPARLKGPYEGVVLGVARYFGPCGRRQCDRCPQASPSPFRSHSAAVGMRCAHLSAFVCVQTCERACKPRLLRVSEMHGDRRQGKGNQRAAAARGGMRRKRSQVLAQMWPVSGFGADAWRMLCRVPCRRRPS